MILAVSLSPSVDINMEVDNLYIGKTNKIISKKTYYTGNSLIIATGLAHLNASVFVTGFMYEDNAAQFEHELHREGVSYSFIWNKGRVGENYKIIDRRSMLTEISYASSQITYEKKEELIQAVKKYSANCEAVVVSGALPQGMSATYYNKILSCVPQNIPKIVDADGDSLIQSLKCGLKLVKPNLSELEKTLKRRLQSKEELLSGCREILDMGAEIVLVSLGKDGAVITDGNSSYYCKSINVAKNSTIGAGGGMVAGATNALLKGENLPEILRCGIAAGTAAVITPDTISFEKRRYEDILSTLSVEKI